LPLSCVDMVDWATTSAAIQGKLRKRAEGREGGEGFIYHLRVAGVLSYLVDEVNVRPSEARKVVVSYKGSRDAPAHFTLAQFTGSSDAGKESGF
jgi:hypothetical protein